MHQKVAPFDRPGLNAILSSNVPEILLNKDKALLRSKFKDYAMESGATRNFEANRMWQLMEKREADAKAEEERANPMVALENRTAKSNQQMIMQENLEELYELAEKIGLLTSFNLFLFFQFLYIF